MVLQTAQIEVIRVVERRMIKGHAAGEREVQAHHAAVDGAAGGFGAGVAMVRAQWVANGSTGVDDNVANFGDGTVDTNATGWPTNTTDGNNSIASDTSCVVLQG